MASLGHRQLGPEQAGVVGARHGPWRQLAEPAQRLHLVRGDAHGLRPVECDKVPGQLLAATPVEDQGHSLAISRDLAGIVDKSDLGPLAGDRLHIPRHRIGWDRGWRQDVERHILSRRLEGDLAQTGAAGRLGRWVLRSRDQPGRPPPRKLQKVIDSRSPGGEVDLVKPESCRLADLLESLQLLEAAIEIVEGFPDGSLVVRGADAVETTQPGLEAAQAIAVELVQFGIRQLVQAAIELVEPVDLGPPPQGHSQVGGAELEGGGRRRRCDHSARHRCDAGSHRWLAAAALRRHRPASGARTSA